MTTLRNISKRKELAQQVYDNYSPLTEEERKELDREVGSAYMGYQTALGDIIQLIVDGKTIEDIKAFIADQLNGKTTRNPFRFTEITTTQMQEYINTTVKEELKNKGYSEKEAAQICKSFIEYPQLRDSIIESNGLKTIRICQHCGKPICEGYLVNDSDVYCSEECVREALLSPEGGWTEDTLNNHLSHADEENGAISKTKWEE